MADVSPAISVLMPVYNGQQYLVEALESVLAQTFANFELLVIDDGSTDSSLEIMQRYSAQDSRVKVVTRENRGLIATLNQGISLARAPFIARMDADDVCHPERFARQVEYLDQHPECCVVGTRVMLIDPEGAPICPFSLLTTHEEMDEAHLAGKGAVICHPSAMIRKTALEQIGGYRAEVPHAEDVDLFLRLAETGRLANLPEILLDYRMHPGSIGHRHALVQQQSGRKAVLDARERRGLTEEGLQAVNRPIPRRETNLHLKWGWWALGAGNFTTARKHAFRALKAAPLRSDAWKLVACALRGH